jgi:hypothetical protein
MTITAIAKDGQEDEFTIRLSDTDAQFMLAALMRRYPVEMCQALMDMVNKSDTEDAVGIEVEAFVADGSKNLPLDKFCLEAAIKLMVAKKSIGQ